MGDGKKCLAPCGHMGEVVIGTYVSCKKCDKKAAPKYVEPEKTEPMFAQGSRCPRCSSTNVSHFKTALDGLGWFVQLPLSVQGLPPDDGDWGCWACGYSWAP